uniref:Protein LEG1-like protein n=1 Tax=Callorhinchus milii TaxID=7868 RepID=A0A4W3IID7_CALMI
MVQLSPLCIICSILLILLINSSFSDKLEVVGDYPPLWHNISESLDGFVSHHNKTLINPWNYLDRMGMYKVLLTVTAESMENLGPDNTGNLLWGLPLQHGWQLETGRLADLSGTSSCGYQSGDPLCISTKSWWSCMNYYLSTIPFLGAVDAGFFEEWPFEIEIQSPEEHVDDFCYGTADCHTFIPEVMIKWRTFLRTKKSSIYKVAPTLSPKEDIISYYLWTAHVASIEGALSKCSERLKYMSAPEARFGISWSNAVEFIAATHFLTNFKDTNIFQAYLPQRMLLASDEGPTIPDLSEEENRVLVTLNLLNEVNTITDGRLLQMWKRSMCSETGRAEGRYLLENMILNPDLVQCNSLKTEETFFWCSGLQCFR